MLSEHLRRLYAKKIRRKKSDLKWLFRSKKVRLWPRIKNSKFIEFWKISLQNVRLDEHYAADISEMKFWSCKVAERWIEIFGSRGDGLHCEGKQGKLLTRFTLPFRRALAVVLVPADDSVDAAPGARHGFSCRSTAVCLHADTRQKWKKEHWLHTGCR